MDKNDVLAFRESFRAEKIPSWYSGILHLSFNGLVLVALTIGLYAQLNDVTPLEWLTFPLVMLLGNIAVYAIHRFPLHMIYEPIYEHTFKVHTEHHHYFFTDDLIIYEGVRDFYILFFPPTVVLGFSLMFLPGCYFILDFFSASANVIWLYLGTSALYFLLYEVLHYISHLPEEHPILFFPLFRYMRNHHVTHHNTKLMYRYNFNIVYPLCDVLFGSVYKGEEEGVI